MWDGLLIIDKERGITSHGVVAGLRRLLGQPKAGHSGTLDPEATGVLVVGLGEATRVFPFLNEARKVYRAIFSLGESTTTQDAVGEVTFTERDFVLTAAEIEAAAKHLTGNIEQVPPMYSAVKLKGKKLYELARQGLEVERPSRNIIIHEWRFFDLQDSYGFRTTVTAEITCSKGTYIRTLIHDLGQLLGCGAHLAGLVRLESGPFRLEQALTIIEVERLYKQNGLTERLLSIDQALSHLPPLSLTGEDVVKARRGGRISAEKYHNDSQPGALVRLCAPNGMAAAVARLDDAGEYQYWQPIRVFQNPDDPGPNTR
jgi:tRNA pseudouridine55 synthase